MQEYLQYFPELNAEQLSKLNKLEELYKEWNERLNLVSRKDLDNIRTRHILHSMGIAKVVTFRKGANVVDVGTGGGLPGVPLAIMFPYVNFTLVDSILKKTVAVKEIVEALELKNVKVVNDRAENLIDTFDYAVSRAVAPAKKLLSWLDGLMLTDKKKLVTGGLYFLKGGDLTDELRETHVNYKLHKLSNHFDDDFFETKAVVQFRRTR